jgi:hypothetical protein
MKTRNGFVSNSSSSSFIIKKKDLTKEQEYKMLHHHKFLLWDRDENSRYKPDLGDVWAIEDRGDEWYVSTWMDNFDMVEFLNHIGVDDSKLIDLEQD